MSGSMAYKTAKDAEWAVVWSSLRLTKLEALELIEGFWYYVKTHHRFPNGLFADAYLYYLVDLQAPEPEESCDGGEK